MLEASLAVYCVIHPQSWLSYMLRKTLVRYVYNVQKRYVTQDQKKLFNFGNAKWGVTATWNKAQMVQGVSLRFAGVIRKMQMLFIWGLRFYSVV